MTVYGLANCNTTMACIKWLHQQQAAFSFHDFKTKGASQAQINAWLKQVPVEKLLNKKSTTWRSLSPEEQSTATTLQGTVALLTKHPTLIKRPVIEWENGDYTVGFDETVFGERDVKK